jgi:hypothetical protein
MRVSTLLGRSACRGAVDGDYTHAATGMMGANITYHPGTGFLYLADNWENVIREIR